MVAIIGVASVALIYYLGRQWFGKLPAILAATLYALSPVNIIYSRSSWNPNPAPFFALLAFFALFKARQSKNFRWWILVGVALAFVIQMHYLALILLPIFGLLWLYELAQKAKGAPYRFFTVGTIGALIAFLALVSPIIIFDLRHNFMNYYAMSAFFTQRETTVNLNLLNSISRMLPIYSDKLIGRYMGVEGSVLAPVLALAVLSPLLIAVRKNQGFKWPYLALGLWLLGSMAGLSLYKQTIYDHYLGFVNPAPYLLLGGLVAYLKGKWQAVTVVALLIVIGFINLQKSPLLSPPANQLQRTQEIAKFIIAQSGEEPFNFALLSAHNYDAAYQFYLGQYNHKPKVVPFEKTGQLFVVCEDKVCQPVGNPKYEIAAFGWAIIDKEMDFNGVKIFRLIHNPEDPQASL